ARRELDALEKTANTEVPQPAPAPAEAAKAILQETFAAARREVWETVSGKWKHDSGKLTQSEVGNTRGVLRAKVEPPADFQARFKFAITGGQMWRSVGITFDVAGENESLVYLSAVAGGSKVQVAYKQGGNYVYPAEGLQARAVKLNEAQELTVRV